MANSGCKFVPKICTEVLHRHVFASVWDFLVFDPCKNPVLGCLQGSQAPADYGVLLQDSRLLRRDIAQAIEEREIQKVRHIRSPTPACEAARQ